ncbi:MAG: GGDEF domain-containing protein [Lachnospiraceae bacterium]|nr:GGDEF domain-containing protein [Lachnospiraceae bacterium]
MFKEKAEDSIYINSYENSKEVIANRYALKCLTCAMIVLVMILILNVADIFVIDKATTAKCVVLCFIVYVCIIMVKIFGDISKNWVKYYILFGVVVWITIISTFLTYHALLACALPLVSCSVYVSKKVTIYTYALMVISTCISVYVGYYIGICDANMVLLTGETLSKYLTPDNEFAYKFVNDNIEWTLALFFVLPRNMILLAFAVISSSISKILNVNMDYARKMKNMAEIDGMTGIYNRSKYISMVEEVYKKEEHIGVIFWDINYLKQINDNEGHEFGDKLILTVAQSINLVANDNDRAYRIGGDEFVMVVLGADSKALTKKIAEWKKAIDKLKRDNNIDVSVAVGYAYGNGSSYEDVLREADKMMYDDKNKLRKR